ncbi:MAG TPA: FHA domain-containing protein [Actinophytocola sp.]|uniref:FHA domain-containing protein n=1 Tax=Actinophytocola sp. TaxID=1872138 RepID=UPI002DDD11CB|nr:FHA domain-containing protein [Actinophytocola sp.]HEV2784519.1 FHA domain-containing protein [Actinophytocola sp.]
MIGTVEHVSTGSGQPDPADQDTVAYPSPPQPDDATPAPATPAPVGTAAVTLTRGSGLTGPVDIPLVADPTVVGRHPDCDIVLADLTISRRHAELRRTGTGFTVTDLGSLNGTYLNGNPVDSARLTDGDHLGIGKYRLVFRAPQA